MDAPRTARAMWKLFEPLHAVTYFADECLEQYRAVGLKGFWMGYFAGRAAPMGAVTPGLVDATFFSFNPDRVNRALPDAWSLAPRTGSSPPGWPGWTAPSDGSSGLTGRRPASRRVPWPRPPPWPGRRWKD
jgi:hypothetical protein